MSRIKSLEIRFLILVLLGLVLCTCEPREDQDNQEPLFRVGDILFDPSLDDSTFRLCNSAYLVKQHYMFGEKTYGREKIAIEKAVIDNFDTSITPDQSGLIRIRFIVNCEGVTGRFRLQGMNWDYERQAFDPSISDQLMAITRSLDQWKKLKSNSGKPQDYYQYLIFKIDDGVVTEILP